MVSWGEVPSSDQNGLIIDYEVLIEPMVTFDDMIMEQRINSTDQFSVNITGLQEFVNYSISVRAYTIVGPGNYSDVIVRMTLEDGESVACCHNYYCESVMTFLSILQFHALLH